jgi:hypothetical protein
VWQEVLRRGYEGLVAKDATSPYVEGRTLAWRKLKVPKIDRGITGLGPFGFKSKPIGTYLEEPVVE